MKISARLISVFGLLSLVFLLFSTPASAQSQNPQVNPYLNPNTNPDVPKNLHTWTQTVMIEVMSAMSCQLTGINPTDPKGKCLGIDPNTGNIGYVEGGGGAIGMAGKMIAMLYTPPLHSRDYFKYLANNFGIAKEAQAATGFDGLQPVQSLWIGFRNIVYLLFVIIFIVIGLAIMFRVRVDPRTVMTIQNQIPKIIFGILLLTFSFAIAGFLIDLMYVVIFLSYEVISSAAVDRNGIPIVLEGLNPLNLQGGTPFTAAGEISSSSLGLIDLVVKAGTSIYDMVKDLLGDAVATLIGAILPISTNAAKTIGELLLGVTGTIVAAFTWNPIPLILGWTPFISDKLFGVGEFSFSATIAAAIASLIIGLAILFSLIRLWFALLMAYIGILLDVVFAPFWIAASLLPGSTIGFGAWARSIIANLAVFPATIIMFLLARVFVYGFGEKPADTDFIPPLLGESSGTDTLGALIAIGIIFMMPGVAAMVKAAFKAPGVPGIGLIGTAIGTGASPYISGGRAVAATQVLIPGTPNKAGLMGAARQIFRF